MFSKRSLESSLLFSLAYWYAILRTEILVSIRKIIWWRTTSKERNKSSAITQWKFKGSAFLSEFKNYISTLRQLNGVARFAKFVRAKGWRMHLLHPGRGDAILKDRTPRCGCRQVPFSAALIFCFEICKLVRQFSIWPWERELSLVYRATIWITKGGSTPLA